MEELACPLYRNNKHFKGKTLPTIDTEEEEGLTHNYVLIQVSSENLSTAEKFINMVFKTSDKPLLNSHTILKFITLIRSLPTVKSYNSMKVEA